MTFLDELIELTIKEAQDLLDQYKQKMALVRELNTLKEVIENESVKKKD